MKNIYTPTLKDKVSASLTLCGFNLNNVCPLLDIKLSTIVMALSGERRGPESLRVLRRLAAFLEEQGFSDIACDLREQAKLWEREAA